MEKLLIVNADDFGLSKGQNYGVIEAYQHGVVSSTTAMVNGGGAEHAAALSRQYPGLPIGLHFVLTHGRPLGAMPSLVNERGELGNGCGAAPRPASCRWTRFRKSCSASSRGS